MRLDPSALPTDEPGPPGHDGGPLPRYDGKRLTFSVNETLPHVCLRCGTEEDVTYRKHIFLWFHPLVHLSLLCGIIPYVIFWNPLLLLIGGVAYRIVKKEFLRRVEPVIPLCVSCHSVITTADLVRTFWPGIIVLVVFISGFLGSTDVLHLGYLWAIPGAASLFFIYLRFVAGKRLTVTRIHEGVISLQGISDVAVRAMML